MKKFELSAYGVESMSKQEMSQTNGGFVWFLASSVLAEYDTIKRGWNDAKAGKPYNY